MWTCPKCRQKFVNTNQWHSCGQNTLENFLANKTEKTIELYNHIIKEFRAIGDFELHPAKTRIALNKKMRFASINRLGKDFLDGHLVLTKRFDKTLCFHRIEVVTARACVHHFRLCTKDDLTDELKEYMRMAYEVGTRQHLERRTTTTNTK